MFDLIRVPRYTLLG